MSNEKIAVLSVMDKPVGKTQLLHRLCEQNAFQEKHTQTIGWDLRRIENKEKKLKYFYYELGAAARFSTFVGMPTTRDAAQILLVFSYDNKQSFSDLPALITEIKTINPDAKITIVGNKADHQPPQVNSDEARALANQHGAHFFSVSAKTNIGIDALRQHIETQALEHQAQPKKNNKKESNAMSVQEKIDKKIEKLNSLIKKDETKFAKHNRAVRDIQEILKNQEQLSKEKKDRLQKNIDVLQSQLNSKINTALNVFFSALAIMTVFPIIGLCLYDEYFKKTAKTKGNPLMLFHHGDRQYAETVCNDVLNIKNLNANKP